MLLLLISILLSIDFYRVPGTRYIPGTRYHISYIHTIGAVPTIVIGIIARVDPCRTVVFGSTSSIGGHKRLALGINTLYQVVLIPW